MATKSTSLFQKPLVNKFSLFIGAIGLVVLLLQSAQASPSTQRGRGGKSANANSGSRTSRSTNNPPGQMDISYDFNSTLDGSEEKLCTGTGSDRPTCRKVGLNMKEVSLELIKQDILKKLRMDANKLPNVSAQNFFIPPQYLSEFVDMQGDSPSRDDNYDDEHATTEKIIAFSKPEQVGGTGKQAKNLHHFSFSDKMANMNIESATLYVHVRYAHHALPEKKNNLHIRIMENIPTKEGDAPLMMEYGIFKASHLQGGSANGMVHGRHKSKWVQVDIRSALEKWIAGSVTPSSRKITLAIDAVNSTGHPLTEVTVVSSSESDVNTCPFIEVHVDGARSRQTRNVGMTCDENSKETRCCKFPLTVDFEEFGWDWIIAPKKYDANYCSGECPFAFLQKYPHNHIVQQAVPSGVGGPCCAARKMSSISMLYFDGDSNIVYSVLPGMVVEKCGCS